MSSARTWMKLGRGVGRRPCGPVPVGNGPGAGKARRRGGHGEGGRGQEGREEGRAAQAPDRRLPPGGDGAGDADGGGLQLRRRDRRCRSRRWSSGWTRRPKDSAVKAVVVLLDQADDRLGPGRRSCGRRSTALKAAGKEVIAPRRHDRRASASTPCSRRASRLSVVPTADLWVTGLYGESPYLRGCSTSSA